MNEYYIKKEIIRYFKGADGGFAVFAHVISGMDIVETIHNLPADGDPPGGDERFRGQFLTENVVIESATVVREAGEPE